MGVALTIIVILASAGAGVAAEARWPQRAIGFAHWTLTATLYTLIPFVVFFNLAVADLDANLGGGIVLAWISLALTAVLAWIIGRRLLHLSDPATGALVCCTLISNSGYLGYPLVASLLGFDSLGEAVLFDISVNGPAVLLFGFAVAAALGDRAGESPRQRVAAFFTRNPPLFAAVAGLLAPGWLAPDLLVDASRAMVVALLPLGFFAVGAVLAEETEEGGFRIGPPWRPPVATVVALRLIVAPALLYLLALPLIELPDTYLLLAAMPCGISALVAAHVYGLDSRLTAEAVAWSTAIALAAVLASLAL